MEIDSLKLIPSKFEYKNVSLENNDQVKSANISTIILLLSLKQSTITQLKEML